MALDTKCHESTDGLSGSITSYKDKVPVGYGVPGGWNSIRPAIPNAQGGQNVFPTGYLSETGATCGSQELRVPAGISIVSSGNIGYFINIPGNKALPLHISISIKLSFPSKSPFPLQLPRLPLTIQPTTQTTFLSSPTPSAPPQQSWVWTYFESKLEKVQCTKRITKSMIEHLSCMHIIDNSKKRDKHQKFITSHLKQKHIECHFELTPNTLKCLIATLIASADLHFSFVKNEAFLTLLKIINPCTSNIICKRQTIAFEVLHLYIGYCKQLKMLLG
ncbi:uncharacterized protein VP01_129g5 [Puccinia sorghi]|uniref:Uncharacterized protein n=1 Tax=Puccinia sorghi TaxID=27349 RepID=A0A0L6VPW6_9BASI|nr:uncharacterized protein VP01_129g5 [Puccinia sorghi]